VLQDGTSDAGPSLQAFPAERPESMTLVVCGLVVGSSKESMHRRWSVAAAAILSVAFCSLIVSSLFLLLFSLTLGVGVLILCDRRLRMKFRGFMDNRTQHLFGPARTASMAPDWRVYQKTGRFDTRGETSVNHIPPVSSNESLIVAHAVLRLMRFNSPLRTFPGPTS